jgi:hypothetical protein
MTARGLSAARPLHARPASFDCSRLDGARAQDEVKSKIASFADAVKHFSSS